MDRREQHISVDTIAELAVFSYFSFSFVYYLNFLPLGHVINLAFAGVFAVLVVVSRDNIEVSTREAVILTALALMLLVSVLSWILRDMWDPSGAARSLTWITPITLALLLLRNRRLNFPRISLWVAWVGLLVNLAITLLFSSFDFELRKFEVNASWTWVSSNELSFHLVVFVALFFILSRKVRGILAGSAVTLLSIAHLSKAHLLALAAGAIAAVSGRRAWVAIGIAALMFFIIRWLFISGVLDSFGVPAGFERVFRPFLDALTVVSDVIFSGVIFEIDALADSIGGYRFEVYVAAFDMVRSAPFGYSQEAVSSGLNGLDPHSNLLYLGLREGWFVLATYMATSWLLIFSVPKQRLAGRLAFAVLVYAFVRGIFLTFDPVKLVALGVYSFFALAPVPSLTARESSGLDRVLPART